jgi:CheY-like chemotaxis protein
METTEQLPASGRPGTILLVDDEPEALRAMERMLRGVGYQVEAFTSARAAIRRVSAGGVHVVVSDISMPEMTGVELLRTIRAHDADLPVVLVTGLPAIDSATDAVEYGAFKYIVKPFEPEVLRLAVERARKLYRLARMKREALKLLGANAISADRAGLEASFDSALESLWMAFQPILRAGDHSVFGGNSATNGAVPKNRNSQTPRNPARRARSRPLSTRPDGKASSSQTAHGRISHVVRRPMVNGTLADDVVSAVSDHRNPIPSSTTPNE